MNKKNGRKNRSCDARVINGAKSDKLFVINLFPYSVMVLSVPFITAMISDS